MSLRLFFPVLLLLGCGGLRPGLSNDTVAAGGMAVVELVVRAAPDGKSPRVTMEKGLLRLSARESEGRYYRFLFTAGNRPGRETLIVRYPDRLEKFGVRLVADTADVDGDGFPDAAELRDSIDRRRFRAWFCAVAEAQFAEPWPRWERAQRDCAGLVRFAYAEALKRHDGRWFSRSGQLLRTAPPDVRAFHYPDVPLLGIRLFRVKPVSGRFATNDFASFASARYLLAYNTRFVSRKTADALPGDLLFYRQQEDGGDRFEDSMHIMVVLPEKKVVYHTGNPKTGEVRRLKLSVLARHPDWRWHPLPGNANFLGVYRFRILEDRSP